MGQLGHTHFGITHRCRWIIINRAKVTLTVNHRITQAKILCHPHNRIIYRTIAMGMVLTNDITDHTCRLLIRLVVVIRQDVHSVHHTAMYRLEPIAHIRQRTRYNDAHRIIQIGLFQFFDDANRTDRLAHIHSLTGSIP